MQTDTYTHTPFSLLSSFFRDFFTTLQAHTYFLLCLKCLVSYLSSIPSGSYPFSVSSSSGLPEHWRERFYGNIPLRVENSAILLEHIPSGQFILLQRHFHNHIGCCSIFGYIVAKNWKHSRCLYTDEWLKKMWYVYRMEYYSTVTN